MGTAPGAHRAPGEPFFCSTRTGSNLLLVGAAIAGMSGGRRPNQYAICTLPVDGTMIFFLAFSFLMS